VVFLVKQQKQQQQEQQQQKRVCVISAPWKLLKKLFLHIIIIKDTCIALILV
jgi:hypothetical protein